MISKSFFFLPKNPLQSRSLSRRLKKIIPERVRFYKQILANPTQITHVNNAHKFIYVLS
jgi:hypothetical protein